jgi:hypothetical protein
MVAYSFQKRFVQAIRVGLSSVSLSFDCPPKLQTIRPIGKRRHAGPGETLQLYSGMRTKHCFKIGEGRCTRVRWITIWIGESIGVADLTVQVEDHGLLGARELDSFAKNDGFDGWSDMAAFWRDTHGLGKFNGRLIEWEPIR